MRAPARYQRLGRSQRLARRAGDDPPSFWTEALGDPPSVYGERIVVSEGRTLRRWDPSRSKLGAALAKDWTEPLPREGERWLYLGAATGTTVSHVADLLGPTGAVYAVEKSVRPFSRLLLLSERYPNLAPILADARRPLDYISLVPPVDGVYIDVAQPDQVAIAVANARLFLRSDGALLLALKTASMGRDRSPREHLDEAVEELSGGFEVEATEPLEPFHKRHYLIGTRPTRRLFHVAPGVPQRPAKRRSGPPAARGS
jgi:fibrillarin-like pre-rRNA processing protein